jgi:pimeloyl-ACP methyl ester carboxylesterase
MALDTPERIERVAVLDILPTSDYWDRMDRLFSLKIYHWSFLAQPAPFPEKLIAASPIRFLEHTLQSWTAAKTLESFSKEALADNRTWFCDPDRIGATCEDYRAGATVDYDHDRQTRDCGQTIDLPLLALWGDRGIATSVEEPLDVWRQWSPGAEGPPCPAAISCRRKHPRKPARPCWRSSTAEPEMIAASPQEPRFGRTGQFLSLCIPPRKRGRPRAICSQNVSCSFKTI